MRYRTVVGSPLGLVLMLVAAAANRPASGQNQTPANLPSLLSSAAVALLQAVRADQPSRPFDPGQRFYAGRDQLKAGQNSEALYNLLWFWLHALDYQPSYVGVRSSYLVDEVKKLVSVDGEARLVFGYLRDQLGPELNTPAVTAEKVKDWASLNKMLNDPTRTESWIREAARVPAARNEALVLAAELDKLDLAEELIRAGADPNYEGRPINTACNFKNLQVAEALLSSGGRVDGPVQPSGYSALVLTARILTWRTEQGPMLLNFSLGRLAVILFLIQHGANANTTLMPEGGTVALKIRDYIRAARSQDAIDTTAYSQTMTEIEQLLAK